MLFLGGDNYGCLGTITADPGRGVGADGRRLPAFSAAAGAAGPRACVRVAPPKHDAAGAAKRAKQIVKDYPIQYMPSGVAARCAARPGFAAFFCLRPSFAAASARRPERPKQGTASHWGQRCPACLPRPRAPALPPTRFATGSHFLPHTATP